jgi:hypothetical protein
MPGAVTSPANSAPGAALGGRRLAVLPAAALVTVRRTGVHRRHAAPPAVDVDDGRSVKGD